MDKFLELIAQRRVWAGVIGAVVFALGILGVQWTDAGGELPDLLMEVGKALGALVVSVLALWSYLKPKQK